MNLAKFFSFAVAAMTIASAASAGIVDNATVSVSSPSGAYGGYPASDAIDTGAGRYSTDFAGNGTGTTTKLDFVFAAPTTFTKIVYTDRTSSGAVNGSNMYGVTDFVTQYQYDFFSDALFSNNVGTFTSSLLVAPSNPTSYLDFQHNDAIGGFTAQYVRFSVLQAAGPNPGAADFEFTAAASAVPEPGTVALLGLGLLGFAASRRKSVQQ